MSTEQSIRALIQLIDDPDEQVFEHVRDQLKSYGPFAIPYLEDSWNDDHFGLIFQSRVEQIIHEIQYEDIRAQLTTWYDSSEKDLLEGAIIVAKYQYAGLNEELIRQTIQAIKRDVWLEINSRMTAYEQVKVLNKVIFGTHNFHGDSKHFHSPMNSYINTVIESRKGNPLSISLIYSVVAQSLDIPIYGVNLPNHFVLAYLDMHNLSRFLTDTASNGVLFYINAFSKGSILDKAAIKEFLDGLNLPHNREYFEPCSNSAIIRRMLTNLITSFQHAGNAEKVNELIALRELLD